MESKGRPSRSGAVVQIVLAALGTLAIAGFVGHPDLGTSKGMAMMVAAITVVGFLYYNGIQAFRSGGRPEPEG